MEKQNRWKINQLPIEILLFRLRWFKVKDVLFRYKQGKKKSECGGKLKRYSNTNIYYILSEVDFEKTQLSGLSFTIIPTNLKLEIRLDINFIGVKSTQHIKISSYYLNKIFESYKLPVLRKALIYQDVCEYFALNRQRGEENLELDAQKNRKNMDLIGVLDLKFLYDILMIERKHDHIYCYEEYQINYFLGKNNT